MDPLDRDRMIRTIWGEAADQGPVGQAAVAHVIMNRLKAGTFGKTPTQVVLAPNQFEPWQARPGALMKLSPRSEEYQAIGDVVDRVENGDLPDPTNGALNFFAPELQAELGRPVPKWAKGEGQRIGGHVFFNPTKVTQVQAEPQSNGVSFEDIFAPRKVVTQQAQTAAPESGGVSFDEIFSSKSKNKSSTSFTPPPGAQPAPPISLGDKQLNWYDPGYPKSQPYEPPSIMEGPKSLANQALKDFTESFQSTKKSGEELATSGYQDISANRPATGAAKVALGTGIWALSPAAGAMSAAIEKPLERLTGNKEFSQKAAMMVPGSGASKLATAARPQVAAIKDIIKDIHPDQLATTIQRLEKSPNLTLMDVAPAVRGNAAGMATDPRNTKAMSELTTFSNQRMTQRGADTKSAFEDVLGPTPNMKTTVDDLKAAAEKAGKESIEPVVASAKPVNVTKVVGWIDSQIDPYKLKQLKNGEAPTIPMNEVENRLWSLRNRIRGKADDREEMFAKPDDIHELSKELRRNSNDPTTGFQGREVRRQLIDAMDNATEKKGAYRAALREYADAKQTEEAFKEGFNIFSNPTGAENSIANHPDMWKAWLEDASQAEKEAIKKGILFGADTRIKNMRSGVNIPEGSFTQERIASVVGEKEAQKIIDKLNEWRDISATHNVLTQNSATALRQAGQKNREFPERSAINLQNLSPAAFVGVMSHMGSNNPILSTSLAALTLGGQKALDVSRRVHHKAENKAYAQWASATGQKKEDLLGALREELARREATRMSDKAGNLTRSPLFKLLPQ